jgi:hypothetical protein
MLKRIPPLLKRSSIDEPERVKLAKNGEMDIGPNGRKSTQINDVAKESLGKESGSQRIGLREFGQFPGKWGNWAGANQQIIPIREANEVGTAGIQGGNLLYY